MPELPDVTVYVEALERRVIGHRLEEIRLNSPFVLRTVVPPVAEAQGRRRSVRRLAKRIVIALEGGFLRAAHDRRPAALAGAGQAAGAHHAGDSFDTGAGVHRSRRAARLAALVEGPGRAAAFDRGGASSTTSMPPPRCAPEAENRALKRALTIRVQRHRRAYSDEILHRARRHRWRWLSTEETSTALPGRRCWPMDRAPAGERARIFRGRHRVPRDGVHGRFGKPCPDCGAPVQRTFADNETNDCANCQTRGTVLADRALSRLLKASWPRSIDELG
jgi:formamidopyrimidine-DNA glycosylase